VRFGKRYPKLLPFCEYVIVPGKSPVEIQPEIIDIFLMKKVYLVCVYGECDMDQLLFISFYPPSL
jgi:hypothetical protein